MRAVVRKWGNSLALRLPRGVASELRVDPDSEVELSVEQGRLVVTPVPASEYRLGDLIAKITSENRHDAEDWGPPRGGEVW